MSPVSRGRKKSKQKKGATRKAAAQPSMLPDLPVPAEECDCPRCSGDGVDPAQLVDELVAGVEELFAAEDPLDIEVAGATFLAVVELAGEGFEQALVEELVPEFEARATPEALVMLLATASVAPGPAAKVARAAADRLVQAGMQQPDWTAELDEPVTVTECVRVRDADEVASILACSFHRAGRAHAFVMSVDHKACDAASDIHVLEADDLPEAVEMMVASGREHGVEVTKEEIAPADLRWHVERALDARAVHDSELPEPDLDGLPDDDGPGYRALAALLRVRMNALPVPDAPKPLHGHDDDHSSEQTLARLLAQFTGGGPSGVPAPSAKLPAKRKKSAGPAPTYQVKVGLRGAKPPIWRRLLVPADISLARLHTVIQVAFGWEDAHLHVFDTPYGEFGRPDAELGHRSEAKVTLEQVAPDAKAKVGYTYDFGDDWRHDILVEKVLDPAEQTGQPRCVGGRRAAPPEDCGGIWGYANLTEIFADPTHPDHEDMLEWLGLESPAEFRPADFDADLVDGALAQLR